MKIVAVFHWIFIGLLSLTSPAYGQVKISKGFITDLREFLAIPNDANDKASMQENLNWLVNAFESRGFDSQNLSSDDYSLLFVERKASQAKNTILFYFHYDGQPIDASQWQQANPYQAVLKRRIDNQWTEIPWSNKEFNSEDRIFARSASYSVMPVSFSSIICGVAPIIFSRRLLPKPVITLKTTISEATPMAIPTIEIIFKNVKKRPLLAFK